MVLIFFLDKNTDKPVPKMSTDQKEDFFTFLLAWITNWQHKWGKGKTSYFRYFRSHLKAASGPLQRTVALGTPRVPSPSNGSARLGPTTTSHRPRSGQVSVQMSDPPWKRVFVLFTGGANTTMTDGWSCCPPPNSNNNNNNNTIISSWCVLSCGPGSLLLSYKGVDVLLCIYQSFYTICCHFLTRKQLQLQRRPKEGHPLVFITGRTTNQGVESETHKRQHVRG